MSDYETIKRAIEFLDSRHTPPGLEELATFLGLSVFQTQRLFARWAGISPKRFTQAIVAERARLKLLSKENVLQTSLEVGLSGPGRLHDLTVNVYGATPGEIRKLGADLTITWGYAESPLGLALIAATPRGICALSFLENQSDEGPLTRLKKEWCSATLQRDDTRAEELSALIFSGFRGEIADPIHVYVQGTNFQIRVWRALLDIPSGEISSYGEIAEKVQSPRASRAVGGAVGANPVAVLIPCHRVLRANGDLGGYHWGLERKRILLALEIKDQG